MTEICSELGYGVVDGVGGHTRCLRDGICPELRGGDIPSESEKVVEKGVPLHIQVKKFIELSICPVLHNSQVHRWVTISHLLGLHPANVCSIIFSFHVVTRPLFYR